MIFALLALLQGLPDPTGGNFTLDDATRGLSGKGALVASIVTTLGELRCQLWDDKAPRAVANFVGLARGKRPWKDPKTGQWMLNKPFYDGLVFHRVVPGFLIQAGDPLANGTGNAGYSFDDENAAKLDRPGLLGMATRGPNTNGSQFFITEMPRIEHLDGRVTLFGACEPLDLIRKIARVPRDDRDKPVQPVVIKKVSVRRSKGP